MTLAMAGPTSKSPAVSVIIVNFNGGDWLKKSVESVSAQSLENFECFIVDNGSTDHSLDALPKLDDRFSLIRLEENLGFAVANNMAAKKASADWIALLNPDAFAHPDWLENLIETPQLSTNVTMAGSRQNMALEPGILDGLGDFYHASGLAWRAGCGHKDNGPIAPYHEAFGPCGAAALYHRETFLRLGGFNESFFCYHEDVDLAYRMRLDGGICIQNNLAVVEHVSSGISGRGSEFAVYHGTRNRIWTYLNNTPLALQPILLPLHLAMNTFMLFWSGIRSGRFKPTFKGVIDGFFKRPKHERTVRKISLSQVLSMLAWTPKNVYQRSLPPVRTFDEAT